MSNLTLSRLVLLLALVGACRAPEGGLPAAALRSPVQPTAYDNGTPFPWATHILPGQEVTGTYGAMPSHYAVIPPVDGTLVVRLSWDHARHSTNLILLLDDREFSTSGPDKSPVVGRVAVVARQAVLIAVDSDESPWDYGSSVPYMLVAFME